jgi:hypothetical protein
MGIKVDFIFIYQIGINNCQIALRIMGMTWVGSKAVFNKIQIITSI